jgi:hypothetical protein
MVDIICVISFNIKSSPFFPHNMGLDDSLNKQGLFPKASLSDWSFYGKVSASCEVGTDCLDIISFRFVLYTINWFIC